MMLGFRDVKSGGQEETQEQAVLDVVLGWLALYLPSWGTSVVLHVAVITLAMFLVWQTRPVEPTFAYRSAVVPWAPLKTTVRPPALRESRDRGEVLPTIPVREFTKNPFPDVAPNRLEPIGIGDQGPSRIGSSLPPGGAPQFIGIGTPAGTKKVVYVVDRSGSMTDSIDYVKYELKRSISERTEDKEFHVVFYSSGPPVEMPTRRLVNATERNKQLAFEFIDGVVPQGETDPSKALERAFACNPELIYLLTDGEFDKTIVGLVKRLNVGGKITVHTIGFLYQSGEAVLKQIADENNGQYKFVSEADLATLVQ